MGTILHMKDYLEEKDSYLLESEIKSATEGILKEPGGYDAFTMETDPLVV